MAARRPSAPTHPVGPVEILTAQQVGDRLQLQARQVRRLFAAQAFDFSSGTERRKLLRFDWYAVLTALSEYRTGKSMANGTGKKTANHTTHKHG